MFRNTRLRKQTKLNERPQFFNGLKFRHCYCLFLSLSASLRTLFRMRRWV